MRDMPLPDPIRLRHKILSTTVISTSYQEKGNRLNLYEAVFHNNSDIFVVAHSTTGPSHGDLAARLAVESAVWTINLAKQKPSYWKDKKLLGGRIARCVHTALYNKRKEQEFADGLGSTLSLLLFGERNFFVYNAGDSRILLYRKRVLQVLTPLDDDHGQHLKTTLGVGDKPSSVYFYSDRMRANDVFLLLTHGVGDYAPLEKMKTHLEEAGDTQTSITYTAKQIADLARAYGSTDNMTVCIVKILYTQLYGR